MEDCLVSMGLLPGLGVQVKLNLLEPLPDSAIPSVRHSDICGVSCAPSSLHSLYSCSTEVCAVGFLKGISLPVLQSPPKQRARVVCPSLLRQGEDSFAYCCRIVIVTLMAHR